MPGCGMVISVRLGPELSGDFAEFCELHGVVNRSEFVRQLIKERVGMHWNINVDGGCAGNPGPAGIGLVARNAEGARVDQHSQHLGPNMTNMQAEYHAVKIALERALAAGVTSVRVLSDCEVVCNQLNGKAKTNDPQLIEIRGAVVVLIRQLAQFEISHIYKEQNPDADELAKQAARRGW